MSEAEARSIGLTVEEASGPPVEIWPDNVLPHNVFVSMSTQWTTGPGGVIGLNYSSLEPVLRLMAIPRHKWPQLFADIREMEGSAMDQIRRNSK